MDDNDTPDAGEPAPEIESVLLHAIAGDTPGHYLVLGNWGEEASEPDDTTACVVAVDSLPAQLAWRTLYSIDGFVQVLARVTPTCYLMGTPDGELIEVSDGVRRTLDTACWSITSIRGNSERDCWFTYWDGLAHWDGQQASRHVAAGVMYAIDAAHDNVMVAVGSDGMVLRFDGGEWERIESVPTNANLIGVVCAAPDEVYVCGWQSAFYRWDGQDRWLRIDFAGDEDMDDLYLSSPVRYRAGIYVCVQGLGLYKVDGKRAHLLRRCNCHAAVVIGDKLVLTGPDWLAEFDGTSWKEVTIVLPATGAP